MSGKKIAVLIHKVGMVIALIGLISNAVSSDPFTFNIWMIIGFSIAVIGLIGETYFYFKKTKKQPNEQKR